MNEIILFLRDEAFKTFYFAQRFFEDISPVSLGLTFVLIFILFIRKWELKRTVKFFGVLFLLFVMIIRIEAYLPSVLGAESASLTIGIARTLFIILGGLIFIYYAMIKE